MLGGPQAVLSQRCGFCRAEFYQSSLIRRKLPAVETNRKQAMVFEEKPSEVAALGRSRPAADAAREAVQRWLLDGLDVSVGHRRCSRDPSSKNDARRTPASYFSQ